MAGTQCTTETPAYHISSAHGGRALVLNRGNVPIFIHSAKAFIERTGLLTKPKVDQDPHRASPLQNHKRTQKYKQGTKAASPKDECNAPQCSCLQLFWRKEKTKRSSDTGWNFTVRTMGLQLSRQLWSLPLTQQDWKLPVPASSKPGLAKLPAGSELHKKYIPLTGDEEKQIDFVISLFLPISVSIENNPNLLHNDPHYLLASCAPPITKLIYKYPESPTVFLAEPTPRHSQAVPRQKVHSQATKSALSLDSWKNLFGQWLSLVNSIWSGRCSHSSQGSSNFLLFL